MFSMFHVALPIILFLVSSSCYVRCQFIHESVTISNRIFTEELQIPLFYSYSGAATTAKPATTTTTTTTTTGSSSDSSNTNGSDSSSSYSSSSSSSAPSEFLPGKRSANPQSSFPNSFSLVIGPNVTLRKGIRLGVVNTSSGATNNYFGPNGRYTSLMTSLTLNSVSCFLDASDTGSANKSTNCVIFTKDVEFSYLTDVAISGTSVTIHPPASPKSAIHFSAALILFEQGATFQLIAKIPSSFSLYLVFVHTGLEDPSNLRFAFFRFSNSSDNESSVFYPGTNFTVASCILGNGDSNSFKIADVVWNEKENNQEENRLAEVENFQDLTSNVSTTSSTNKTSSSISSSSSITTSTSPMKTSTTSVPTSTTVPSSTTTNKNNNDDYYPTSNSLLSVPVLRPTRWQFSCNSFSRSQETYFKEFVASSTFSTFFATSHGQCARFTTTKSVELRHDHNRTKSVNFTQTYSISQSKVPTRLCNKLQPINKDLFAIVLWANENTGETNGFNSAAVFIYSVPLVGFLTGVNSGTVTNVHSYFQVARRALAVATMAECLNYAPLVHRQNLDLELDDEGEVRAKFLKSSELDFDLNPLRIKASSIFGVIGYVDFSIFSRVRLSSQSRFDSYRGSIVGNLIICASALLGFLIFCFVYGNCKESKRNTITKKQRRNNNDQHDLSMFTFSSSPLAMIKKMITAAIQLRFPGFWLSIFVFILGPASAVATGALFALSATQQQYNSNSSSDSFSTALLLEQENRSFNIGISFLSLFFFTVVPALAFVLIYKKTIAENKDDDDDEYHSSDPSKDDEIQYDEYFDHRKTNSIINIQLLQEKPRRDENFLVRNRDGKYVKRSCLSNIIDCCSDDELGTDDEARKAAKNNNRYEDQELSQIIVSKRNGGNSLNEKQKRKEKNDIDQQKYKNDKPEENDDATCDCDDGVACSFGNNSISLACFLVPSHLWCKSSVFFRSFGPLYEFVGDAKFIILDYTTSYLYNLMAGISINCGRTSEVCCRGMMFFGIAIHIIYMIVAGCILRKKWSLCRATKYFYVWTSILFFGELAMGMSVVLKNADYDSQDAKSVVGIGKCIQAICFVYMLVLFFDSVILNIWEYAKNYFEKRDEIKKQEKKEKLEEQEKKEIVRKAIIDAKINKMKTKQEKSVPATNENKNVTITELEERMLSDDEHHEDHIEPETEEIEEIEEIEEAEEEEEKHHSPYHDRSLSPKQIEDDHLLFGTSASSNEKPSASPAKNNSQENATAPTASVPSTKKKKISPTATNGSSTPRVSAASSKKSQKHVTFLRSPSFENKIDDDEENQPFPKKPKRFTRQQKRAVAKQQMIEEQIDRETEREDKRLLKKKKMLEEQQLQLQREIEEAAERKRKLEEFRLRQQQQQDDERSRSRSGGRRTPSPRQRSGSRDRNAANQREIITTAINKNANAKERESSASSPAKSKPIEKPSQPLPPATKNAHQKMPNVQHQQEQHSSPSPSRQKRPMSPPKTIIISRKKQVREQPIHFESDNCLIFVNDNNNNKTKNGKPRHLHHRGHDDDDNDCGELYEGEPFSPGELHHLLVAAPSDSDDDGNDDHNNDEDSSNFDGDDLDADDLARLTGV